MHEEVFSQSNKKEPTDEQKNIINETSNCVVIAQPGSGKTFTLSCKIKEILGTLPEHKGVIAISYTNKASDELKLRCLSGNINKKSSYFGTIDKFYLTEIVLPFGKQVFGVPTTESKVVKDFSDGRMQARKELIVRLQYNELEQSHIDWLRELFLSGTILLQTVGLFALYLIDNSLACRKYLKARYTHIIIDEYQDSGKEQHELFIKLKNLGLCAIAVGDINQSIYAFTGKESKYLHALTESTSGFAVYPLSKNHRCHPSIVDYSDKLINHKYEPTLKEDIRVIEKNVDGSEIEIAHWIDSTIPVLMEKYNVTKYKDIGILVRGKRTGKLIHENLKHSHKYFEVTPFDEDSSPWGTIFRKTLNLIFDKDETIYNFIEDYIDFDMQVLKVRRLYHLLNQLKLVGVENSAKLINRLGDFVEIAKIIYPSLENDEATSTLSAILKSEKMLDSFKPASDEEIQIMTLHKSKGLEFDIVFHLDLYRWILPSEGREGYKSIRQDMNLHYVGITRAKECCVLCYSTKRHKEKENNDLVIIDAEKSTFLKVGFLKPFRNDY
jgi:DNA helicase-2/ATP-dependent DNA helicase PcrA